MRERIIALISWSGLTHADLEARTGIKAHVWANLMTRKQRVNEDHITALNGLWPEYAYWISTGKTIPDAGQISPDMAHAEVKKVVNGTP